MSHARMAKNPAKGIILRRASTKGVLEAWRTAYCKGDQWQTNDGRFKPVLSYEETYRRLVKLPADATPDDFAKIIGNKTWTHLRCSSCNELVDEAVEIDERAWTTDEILICEPCLNVVKQAFAHPPAKPTPKLQPAAIDELFVGAKVIAGRGSNCLRPGKTYTVKHTTGSKNYKWCVVCEDGRDHFIRPRSNVSDGKKELATDFFQRKSGL